MLAIALFLLVARRRFLCWFRFASFYFVSFASCFASLLPVSVHSLLLHAALLFFLLVVAFFVSRSFLFWPFSLVSPFTDLWVFFHLAHFSSFFRFLCHGTFTPLHDWFFRFFCQFRYRIICFCVQCPFFSISCVFHGGRHSVLRVSGVFSVARAPSISSCSCV